MKIIYPETNNLRGSLPEVNDLQVCGQTAKLPQSENNDSWGFTMRGIQPAGQCPSCRLHYKRQKNNFVCPKCNGRPLQYRVSIFFKGDMIRRSTTFDGKPLRTPAEAYALKRQADNEIEGHRFDPDKWKSKTKLDFAFSRLIDAWYKDKVEEMAKGDLAPSYVPKLWTYIQRYYRPFFGDKDVREILSLKAFQKQLPGTLSPKYRKNIADALIGFFRTLKEDRKIDEVPVSKPIEVPEHEPTVLSAETQQAILEQILPQHRPIFVFLFAQGVRPSEARALKWKDIEGDTVTIRRTWSESVLRETTKTKRIRHNLLFDVTLKALPAKRFPEDFVFLHGVEKRRPYSSDLLNKIFNAAVRELGLPTISLYEATKHSFGTQQVNDGVPLELLQKWFGHTKAEMTERYAKLKVVDAFRAIQERKKAVVEMGNYRTTAAHRAENQ
jgi:integrase